MNNTFSNININNIIVTKKRKTKKITENQKKIGEPISIDEFYELPIKRKQKYIKKLYFKIGDAE